ncbi:YerC/YecD family TrpR-related protein [Thermosyntropha sp.]|uniref:YerC/YecD family TrpR-related protein n=1 Tax=Thermosyntropha sp. TaxID=2740820 RepID=UPI0025FD43A9|nr:YerC/YecD family TrpR-related protein [Thermosyntropha sp.]MBO8158877.1 DNA-binding transcriptional regulator [Thermosyntropha sp.]
MAYFPNWRDEKTDVLVKAFLSLKNEDDVYRFLDDICTISEIKAMAQRLEVAQLLMDNITYNQIAKDTGASTATISRVKRCLDYGADGYRRVLRYLKEEKQDEE